MCGRECSAGPVDAAGDDAGDAGGPCLPRDCRCRQDATLCRQFQRQPVHRRCGEKGIVIEQRPAFVDGKRECACFLQRTQSGERWRTQRFFQ